MENPNAHPLHSSEIEKLEHWANMARRGEKITLTTNHDLQLITRISDDICTRWKCGHRIEI